MLSEKGVVVALDEERKAAMVSDLLVVLCGEHGAQERRLPGADKVSTDRGTKG
jgi:hypothetical protein